MDKNGFNFSILGVFSFVFVFVLGASVSVVLHMSWVISLFYPIGLCLCLLSNFLGSGNFFDLSDYASSFVDVVIGLLLDLCYGLYDMLDYACFAGVVFLRRIGWRLFGE